MAVMAETERSKQALDELRFYTLSHPDRDFFIHQYVVDAYAAQYADEHSKPIGVAFALMGLYLHLEKSFTGRQVQLAHMRLARHQPALPTFEFPADRGAITPSDVLEAAPGPERDQAIRDWSASVWASWSASHDKVAQWMKDALDISP